METSSKQFVTPVYCLTAPVVRNLINFSFIPEVRKVQFSTSMSLTAAFVLLSLATSAGIPPGQRTAADASSNLNTASSPRGVRGFVVGPRTPINPPGTGYHGEVTAAADPQSAKNLIVCGFRGNPQTGAAYEGYVYQSGDGGKTWREALVDATSQWVAEESCAFGPAHQAYFAAGDSDTSRGVPAHQSGNLHLYGSSDGGRTWRTIQVDRFMDYTSMTVDDTLGPWRNTLYIFANVLADGKGGWLSDKTPYLAARRELPERSFSVASGNFNAGEAGVKFPAKYPHQSAVLSDGTVLALFLGDRELVDETSGKKTRVYSVEMGISEDGGKTLRKISVYEDAVPPVPQGLAVNKTTDEIYVCWTPRYGDAEESNLMLATSRDKGVTWRVGPVRSPQGVTLDLRVNTVSLAVNKDGVLGFMWYGKNADRVYFGASFDGGNSLGQVVPLTPDAVPSLTNSREVADDRRLFVYPPAWKPASHRLEPLQILAFGPNLPGFPFGDAIVADQSGTFHPIWNEVANGPTHLWTRTISFRESRDSTPLLTLDGLIDISDKVVSHISNVRYDRLGNLVAFDITLTNKSETTFASPILLVVTNGSGQLELSADNSDNDKSGDGALWELQIPSDGLACEHSTEPRTLTFHVSSTVSEDDLANYKSFDVPLRIYGKLP